MKELSIGNHMSNGIKVSIRNRNLSGSEFRCHINIQTDLFGRKQCRQAILDLMNICSVAYPSMSIFTVTTTIGDSFYPCREQLFFYLKFFL